MVDWCKSNPIPPFLIEHEVEEDRKARSKGKEEAHH